MKILNCIILLLGLSLQSTPLPLQDNPPTLFSRFNKTARDYMRTAIEYGKMKAQVVSICMNNLKENLMSKINNLKNRGKANVEEAVDEVKDLENISKEDIQRLIEEFYKTWGMEENEEKLDEEKTSEEKIGGENKEVDEGKEAEKNEKEVL